MDDILNQSLGFRGGLRNLRLDLLMLRAHRAAFLSRGQDPERYVVSDPVQVRKKGQGGSPFQNCATILFFALEREALESVESAAACAQRQFEEMTRARLDRSFLAVLELMRVIPAII